MINYFFSSKITASVVASGARCSPIEGVTAIACINCTPYLDSLMRYSPPPSTSTIFKKTTPVGHQYDDRQDKRFVGTGFFYFYQKGILNFSENNGDNDSIEGHYLVTNKHIVEPNHSPNPDKLTIYTRNKNDIRKTTRDQVDLYNRSGNPIWRTHPDNKQIDIAVVPLSTEIESGFSFHRGDLPSDSRDLSGGDLAQVVGYPELLTNFHKLPILRDALISSPYEIAYSDSPFFYIDARLHDGMSGSPVLSAPRNVSIEQELTGKDMTSGEEDFLERVGIHDIDSTTYPSLIGIHSEESIEVNEDISIKDIKDQLNLIDSDEPDLDSYLQNLENRLSDLEVETGLNRVWHSYYLNEIVENT